MAKGKLFLIPTVIAEDTEIDVISGQVKNVICHIRFFLVENVRTARRYISKLKLGIKIDELHFEVLDKNIDASKVGSIMKPLIEGNDVGVISEAGCPGVADPGSVAVAYAHEKGIQVVPMTGPSSILMALMASGFNGQSFVFHGYLPIDKQALNQKIKSMERDALKGQTQIFMDTPYRNQKLFDELLKTCQQNTRLSIAKDITGQREYIKTLTISDWKKTCPELHKIPVIFCLGN